MMVHAMREDMYGAGGGGMASVRQHCAADGQTDQTIHVHVPQQQGKLAVEGG